MNWFTFRFYILRESARSRYRALLWRLLSMEGAPMDCDCACTVNLARTEKQLRVISAQLKQAQVNLDRRMDVIEHLAEECDRLSTRVSELENR